MSDSHAHLELSSQWPGGLQDLATERYEKTMAATAFLATWFQVIWIADFQQQNATLPVGRALVSPHGTQSCRVEFLRGSMEALAPL